MVYSRVAGWASSSTLLLVVAVFGAGIAHAQQTASINEEGEKSSAVLLEEVIVTARRTTESQQSVPIAISALSSDDLKRSQINSPSDLNGKVPSLVVGTGSQMRNTETPTIRGQGAQYGASPGVVIYISEVALPSDPIANYQGGEGKFFDLANVQVLKGSQGTLFGRNTTGGALLLEPHRPHDAFAVSVRGGVSHLSDKYGDTLSGSSGEVVLNLPLIDDTLMARVGGQVFERDGFTHDVETGKDYDDKNYWAARLGVLWQPNERVENYFLALYSDSNTNGTGTVIKRINREGLNQAIPASIGLGAVTSLLPGIDVSQVLNAGCLILNVFGPSTNCGQDILDEQAARGDRRVQLSADPMDQLRSGTYLDKFSYDINEQLTFRNIMSYSTMDHVYRWDLDGSRAGFNEFTNPKNNKSADVETITEELQLQGSARGDNLSYTLGAYYERTEAEGEIIATSLFFVDVTQAYQQTKESFAPFAQATYDLADISAALAGLNITAGVRYTRDTTEGTARIAQLAGGVLPLTDASFSAEVDSSSLTYTLGVDYKIGESMVYGKLSRGYKTGGISTIAVNPDHYTYDPEYVTSIELGQKSDFALGAFPVRLNTALYYTEYEDKQVSAPDAFVDPQEPSPIPKLGQANFNVADAWVAGVELDLTVLLSDKLTLVGSYAYTDAEYDKFSFVYDGATPQRDCTGEDIESGNTVELSCVPFPTVPENQYSLSLRYTLPMGPDLGDVQASISYAWVDEQYSSYASVPDAEPGAWLPDYDLINASISWGQVMGSNFSLQLYGSNLANNKYRVSNSNQWNLTYMQSVMYSEPRKLGLEVSYDFQP